MRVAAFMVFLLAITAPPVQAGEPVKSPDLDQVQIKPDRKESAKTDTATAPKAPAKPEKAKAENAKSGLSLDEPEPACGDE